MMLFYMSAGLLLAGTLLGAVDGLWPCSLGAVVLLVLDAARPAWYARLPG